MAIQQSKRWLLFTANLLLDVDQHRLVTYSQRCTTIATHHFLHPLTQCLKLADSLIAHFNLVCGDAWKVQLLNSFMFAGAFLGSGFFGWMSDRYGRKLPLFTATGITAALLFATSAAPNYAFLAVMRALTGCASAGQNQLFLVCTEVTGPKHRVSNIVITVVACSRPRLQRMLDFLPCAHNPPGMPVSHDTYGLMSLLSTIAGYCRHRYNSYLHCWRVPLVRCGLRTPQLALPHSRCCSYQHSCPAPVAIRA